MPTDPNLDLILVDADDNVVGHLDPASCHAGDGVRHRAFSVFLFDPDGRVLLQRRARAKKLWPGYWSNSVCSHPRRGESIETAARRRVPEELGIDAALAVVYRFEYRARDGETGSEHELCWVLAGRVPEADVRRIRPTPGEVESLRWMEPEALDRAVEDQPERFTPWLKLEWSRLRGDQQRSLGTALDGPTHC